ncbi:hypothetical protein [Streptomyces sp. NPDC058394]|uniref:hypothetical protein n=1 Tax=unclassified Streptomyces TaxID=2593676 RepID=UPI00364BEEF9
MALVLLLVIVAIVLGIIRVVAKGLFYLLVIGVVVLVADLVLLGLRLGRRRWRLPGDAVTRGRVPALPCQGSAEAGYRISPRVKCPGVSAPSVTV